MQMHCTVCRNEMRRVGTLADAAAMAPGFELWLYDCPDGHGQRWRRVFNGPALTRRRSRLRAYATKTTAAARDLQVRASSAAIAASRRVAASVLSHSGRMGKIAGTYLYAGAKRATAFASRTGTGFAHALWRHASVCYRVLASAAHWFATAAGSVSQIAGTYLYAGAKRATASASRTGTGFAHALWRYASVCYAVLTSASHRFATAAISVSSSASQIAGRYFYAAAKRANESVLRMATGLARALWRYASLSLGLLTSASYRFATTAISGSRSVGKIVRAGQSVGTRRSTDFAHVSRPNTAPQRVPVKAAAKSEAMLGALTRMPHSPANRRPGLKRHTMPQTEEAVFLLRRLAKAERRGGLRP